MRKKNRIIILTAASLSAVLLSGCGSKKADAVSEITASGTLRVAVCTEGNSLTRKEGDDYIGQEPLLAETIAGALGVKTEFLPAADREEAKALVGNSEADIAIGMIPATTSLDDTYDVSIPYSSGKFYVMTRRGDYSDCPAAFTGKTLGRAGEIDSSSLGWTGSVQDVNTVSYSEGKQGLQALEDGTIDGYVCRLAEGLSLQKGNRRVQIQNLKNAPAEEYVVVMKSGNSKLKQGINAIIDQMQTDMTEKTGSEEESTAQP